MRQPWVYALTASRVLSVARLGRAPATGRAPDGPVAWDVAGVTRRGAQLHPFFLEYDRGTTSRRVRFGMLRAYDAYVEGGRYAEQDATLATHLVVETSPVGEELFAGTARAAAVGRPVRLRRRLTSEGRFAPGRHNPAGGPLGPIWRSPHT